MNHKHFKQILISNNIIPATMSETKIALKLVKQKEKFILEDSVKALHNNKKNKLQNGHYSIQQYINEIIQNLQEKGYSGTYYIQRYLHVDETLGNTKNPLNIFDENQILKIIPIQFRN